jgi:copper resistance protein C
MRYLKSIVVVVASIAFGMSAAFAHTHLKSSSPPDGSVLPKSPGQLTLTFEDLVQVTAVTITLKGGKARSLKPLPDSVVKEATVTVPALSPGDYVVDWRAAGHDGHVMSGQVKFKIDPPKGK